MSRPILSRPRTRVYGCNYDKGESYYKPMVENLDRKYSGRPLFAEPRNSLADEIAARRNDIGSRSLGGPNDYDDLEYYYGRGSPDPTFEDEFVAAHRRYKERAAAAFEEDLAAIRRKRRDMQDRLFDVIDLNAEIDKAKNTLEAAGNVFQRHAMRFDNNDEDDTNISLAQRLDKSKKLATMELPIDNPKPKQPVFKWTRVEESQQPQEQQNSGRRNRINSVFENMIYGPKGESRNKSAKAFAKRKKSVSF